MAQDSSLCDAQDTPPQALENSADVYPSPQYPAVSQKDRLAVVHLAETAAPFAESSNGNFDKDSSTHDQSNGYISSEIKLQSPESSTDKSIDIEKGIEKTAETPTVKASLPQQNKDPNLVQWDGPDDKENPMNWPTWRKWAISLSMAGMTFVVTFASSVFSTATVATAKEFHVSEEVMVLGTALAVLGFAVGPIVFGPFSELYGRKIPLFFGYIVFAIFQIAVAVAQNLQTIFICRFLGGVFGASPLAVVGGASADMWHPVDRGIVMAIWSCAVFVGPVAGPIVGSFITQSHLGWRWTEYITAIMAFLFGGIGLLVISETYAPVLLQRRAKELRHKTKNWALHSQLDENRVNVKVLANKYLLRAFIMMSLEPILTLMTIYTALIYGIIYLSFEAYPVAFQEDRGWSPGIGSLPFLSIIIGVIIGASIIIYTSKTRYARKLKETGRVVPEERLIPMMLGGIILPIGLFWFAWTSNPSINPWPQIISGVAIGAGLILIFLQGMNYIVDCYLMNANSAISANSLVRCAFGAGFPLFATGM